MINSNVGARDPARRNSSHAFYLLTFICVIVLTSGLWPTGARGRDIGASPYDDLIQIDAPRCGNGGFALLAMLKLGPHSEA